MIALAVEGKHDVRFLTDFITEHFQKESEKDYYFIQLDGKDNLKLEEKKKRILESNDKGDKILIVLDADNDCQGRKQLLESYKNNNALDCDYFTMPDNNNSGDLEDLLFSLIPEPKAGFFGCFATFEQCVIGLGDGFEVPLKKSKVYAYLDSTNRDEQNDAAIRTYLNDCWDLNSVSVNPLKDFLAQYFS